jgi:hypothetical protein
MLENNLGIKHKSTEKETLLLTYLHRKLTAAALGLVAVVSWLGCGLLPLIMICMCCVTVLFMRRTVGIARWHHTSPFCNGSDIDR